MINILYLLIVLNCLSATSISGTITDQTSGEPLPYTNMILLENNRGTATDISGYYIIPNIDFGNYTIKIMMIGYKTLTKTIQLDSSSGKFNFELIPEPIQGDEIKVSAERTRFEKRVDISRVNFTNEDIRKAPAFVESDLFRTIQMLPSVNASNDFNASLIVRGGSPDENLILLDGTEIYNPYHIGGVFSTFNANMISDSEFLAGGFPANYGGRLSSVLSITARDGDSKNGRLPDSLHTLDWSQYRGHLNTKWPIYKKVESPKKYIDFSKGAGDISLLSAKIMAEGYLYNGSWMLSGRRTYFDQFLNLYYKTQEGDSPFNYYFGDIHFKAKTALNANNQLIYSQFSGLDDLKMEIGGGDYPGITFNWYWGNATNNLTWKYIPNSSYLLNTSLSKTKYNFDVDFSIVITEIVDNQADPEDETDNVNDDTHSDTEDETDSGADLTFDIENLVEDITLKQDIKYFYSDELKLGIGWEYKTLNMDYNEYFAGRQTAHLGSRPTIISGYINSTWNPFPILHINSGARVSNYNKYDDLIINPRFGLKFNPYSDLALKASWGMYSQFLYTINQEEELLRIVDFWQPIPDGEKPQEAEHFIIGTEYWLSEGNTISLEAYYKKYSHVYDLNPLTKGTDIEGTLAIPGIGEASGLEFLYRLRRGKLSGWISYAYANIHREIDFNSDGIIWEEREVYPAKYDKPHIFSSILSYELTKKYDIAMACIYSTGQTYTPVIGKVHQSGVNSFSNLDNPYSNFGNIYGPKNSGRYPNYLRMDVSISKDSNTFGLESKWKFQIINLTNHFNVLLYNWNHEASPSQVQAYSMFPIIFTFGWEFNF